jgi:two-component system cell cycle response regulator
VVDDDARSRELLQQLLMLDGYEVRAVDGGQAALALLADEIPDVAVIDLRMPGMDGVELCRKIRHFAPGGSLPVVVLTGMDDDEARLAALAAGADEVLVKPVMRAMLQERLIRVREAAAAGGRGGCA